MIGRCKFKCYSVKDFGGDWKEVEFRTEYDETIPEDVKFNKATPSGSMTVIINNPAVMENLKAGKAFYIDIVPVE